MDASPSPLTLTTRTPISGGSMAAKDEEQAGRVAYSQPMDNNWEGIDWSGFESFCACVLAREEFLPDQGSHRCTIRVPHPRSLFSRVLSIQDPDCFIMDEELKISESPLPEFIELGPEWGCGATEPTASSDPSDEVDLFPEAVPRNAIVKDECIGGTWHCQIDDPDRSLSLSTPTLPVDPSTSYPTPPRSLSPPPSISLVHTYVPARQPTAVADSSTWTSYSESSNVPSPLARNPYRALMFKDVETPSTWGSSSKKNIQPQGGKVPQLDDNRSSPWRRANPYPAMYCLQPGRLSNTQILNDPAFLKAISKTCIQKLTAGTYIYVPIKTAKVAKRIAPLYDQNLDFAKTFFGLQRVAPPPDALHPCPYPSCLAALPIEDFPEHYDSDHSHWSYSECQKGSCPSFYRPHDPNGKHGASCRRQIVCMHGKTRVSLTRENVMKHILVKHLKAPPNMWRTELGETRREEGPLYREGKEKAFSLYTYRFPMAQELDCQTVLAKSKHSATVIFLHGLGSSANNIGRLARSIAADPGLHHIKWIMPQAPLRRCSWLDGAAVPAWYNVGGDGPEDEEGVTQSVKSLSQIVAQEHENGIERVVLGGFSQGACMSLFMGVTLEDLRVAGIVMLSGKMVLPDKLIEGITPRTKNIPVFIAHGTDDDVITLDMNTECVEDLKGARFRITKNTNATGGISYHLYQGLAHSVDLSQEVDDLKDWLKKNVPEDPIAQSSG
ncbi:uncharacterized protein ARMOST_21557 [Armillaria ostoyae]|uniref:Acyl-protein thioesterase 1 n=1 Tax=Armillaria ostoyae TaxID=47428 RepID=A0A284SAI0_ARMOS|nr:uncharacterized protein ARMOST_21557 [Armillaria ostoyae]